MAPGSRLQELTAQYMQNPRRYFVPLANEYRNSRDLDRAIALCREHLPAQPGHMSGHIVLGRAYFEKGDIAAAREVFLTSVSLDSENLIALRHLGDIARLRNEPGEARQWYARVLDADPQNEEIERLIASLGAGGGTPAGPLAAYVPTPVAQSAIAFVTPASLTAVPTPAHVRAFPTPVTPVAAVAAPAAPPVAVPPVEATVIPTPVPDLAAALYDPTPPGLRAITEPEPPADVAPSTESAESLGALPVFDLGSLAEGFDEPVAPPPLPPITDSVGTPLASPAVPGLSGFAFDDLDALSRPDPVGAEDAALPPPLLEPESLVPPAPAELASAEAPAPAADDAADPLLSRPAFGALASFASWRSAKERDTPPTVPVVPATPGVTPTALPPEQLDATFWDPQPSATAPEFVTETMAALYEQQGFTEQALDVYRTLLRRAPLNQSLARKVADLEAALELPTGNAEHDVELPKSLSNNDLPVSSATAFETLFEAPEAPEATVAAEAPAPSPFDADPFWAPTREAPAAATPVEERAGAPEQEFDDWFADVGQDTSAAGANAVDVPALSVPALEGFADSPSLSSADVDLARREAAASRETPSSEVLESLFGGEPVVGTADDAAADLLCALAGEMVGRLPKEAPALPVPDVLDLPVPPSDAAGGGASAPLLSFDRFFSGTGAPPRARMDSPAAAVPVLAPRPSAPPIPSPSLSPTFGGVPVIPPGRPVTPATWAAFDRLASTPPSAITPIAPPAAVAPPATTDAPVVHQPAEPERAAEPTPVPAPIAQQPAPAAPAAEEKRQAPSDFHRWLEGLS